MNDLPGGVYQAAVAPGGDRVALTWCRGKAPNYFCGVHLRPLSGGEPQMLFPEEKELQQNLRWSPDENWIASTEVHSRDGGVLYVNPVAGGEARYIAFICSSYTWTADSRALIVSTADDPNNAPDTCQVRAYSRDGKQLAAWVPRPLRPRYRRTAARWRLRATARF